MIPLEAMTRDADEAAQGGGMTFEAALHAADPSAIDATMAPPTFTWFRSDATGWCGVSAYGVAGYGKTQREAAEHWVAVAERERA